MSAPNDLTSLAFCKAWLGVTSNGDDDLLASLITGVSRAIHADLGRPNLLPGVVTETLDGNGEDAITLRHWPATQVVSVTIDGAGVAASTLPAQAGWVLETADTEPPGAMQRLYLRAGTFPRGVQNVVVTYRAGYEIFGEQTKVPTRDPLTLTPRADYGPWVTDTGVTGLAGSYVVENGVYEFAPVDAGAWVTLSYGYVPADLFRAACEWVADRYATRTRIGQSAKTLGGQETTSFIVQAMPDIVDLLLQPYRRVAR